jgi:hypothetical protein
MYSALKEKPPSDDGVHPSEWASYAAALAGSNVYAVRMNTVVGRWLLLQGTIL